MLGINWDQFQLGKGTTNSTVISGKIAASYLLGTQLSFPLAAEAGKLDNRKIFIEKMFNDICEHCPKDEPLALISLGSDRMLVEYIIGKLLIETGFENISFFLIDPVFVFSSKENREVLDKVRVDFRKQISAAYFEKYQKPFPEGNVRFLSRAQNISKYFQVHSNVALIESLPPYGEAMRDFKAHKIEAKAKNLLTGGIVVPSASQANAIGLIPNAFYAQYQRSGAIFDVIPHSVFRNASGTFYTIDWGCKIRSDGNFRLSFKGEEDFLSAYGISKDKKIVLTTGEVVAADQWIPTMRKALEKELESQNDQPPLSQEKIASRLERIKEIASLYMPGMQCFFLADYSTDRLEALTYLSANAGHHYRKVFCLKADAEETYRITLKQIQ